MNYKPHPKQLEFINDDRPRVLFLGTPCRTNAQWIKLLFISIHEELELNKKINGPNRLGTIS